MVELKRKNKEVVHDIEAKIQKFREEWTRSNVLKRPTTVKRPEASESDSNENSGEQVINPNLAIGQ